MGVHQKIPPKITTVISTKGQVILPAAIRNQRRWKAGTKLTVEDTPEGILLKVAPIFPPTTYEQVAGSLKWDGPPLTQEDIDAALEAEGRRRARD